MIETALVAKSNKYGTYVVLINGEIVKEFTTKAEADKYLLQYLEIEEI